MLFTFWCHLLPGRSNRWRVAQRLYRVCIIWRQHQEEVRSSTSEASRKTGKPTVCCSKCLPAKCHSIPTKKPSVQDRDQSSRLLNAAVYMFFPILHNDHTNLRITRIMIMNFPHEVHQTILGSNMAQLPKEMHFALYFWCTSDTEFSMI